MPDIKPIRLGIVGLGFGLGYMNKTIAGSDGCFVEVRAVCDRSKKRLAEGAAVFNCSAYSGLDDLLADPEIEAVALFSGPVGRANLIRRIMAAGKDMMTTKPFELNPEEALAVLQESRELGRVLHLNSPSTVLGEDIEQIWRWQEIYNLGQLVFANMECWYKSLESADGSWYDDPDQCPVAPILRLGIYGINDLMCVAEDPVEVQVLQSRMMTGRPTPDVAQLSIRFANGAIGMVRNSWCCSPNQGVLGGEFIFERGAIRREGTRDENGKDEVEVLTLNAVDAVGRGVHEQARVPVGKTNHVYRWDLFHQAVRGGIIKNQVEPKRIVNGIRVLQAMARAQKSGRTEKVYCEG